MISNCPGGHNTHVNVKPQTPPTSSTNGHGHDTYFHTHALISIHLGLCSGAKPPVVWEHWCGVGLHCAIRNTLPTTPLAPAASRTRFRPIQGIQTSVVIINLATLLAPLPSTEQHDDLHRRIKYCIQMETVRALVVWLWCERPTHVVELGLGKRPGNDWPLGIFWFLFCSMFAFCRCRHSSLLKMSNRESTRT